jgi:taurine dioxygenase
MNTETVFTDFVCIIEGIDCKFCTESDIHLIKDYLFNNKVLVIKDQVLNPDDYLQFMKKIGEPIKHVLQNYSVDGYPELIKISNLINDEGENEGVLDGGCYWHSDMSYLSILGIATSLYCIKTPSSGGETSFLDMLDGYRKVKNEACITSPLATKSLTLNELVVEHFFGNREQLIDHESLYQPLSAKQYSELNSVYHKLVEIHPTLNQETLFSVCGSSFYIQGFSDRDSIEFLNLLADFIIDNANHYNHKYECGDLVMWDNMTTLHKGNVIKATANRDQCRLLYRINVDYNG